MVRVSNTVVTTLNCIFLIFGLGLVGGGVYFHVQGGTTCHKFLENSLFILGSASVAVSLLGLVGSCCGNNVLLLLYLVFMFLFIIGVAAFATFILLVTNPLAGRIASGLGIGKLRLGDYSHWLQNHFATEKNWAVIKSCLVDSQLCSSLNIINPSDVVDPNTADVLKKNFSPLLSGCCKPPRECGHGGNNGTKWGIEDNRSDCEKWSNKKDQFCYDCNSCKAGFLANIKERWKTLEIFFICLLIFSIVILCIGCRAESNNRHYPSKHRV